MDLTGKTAFITGGGGGIGAGIGEALVEKGMRVVLADIDLSYATEAARPLGDAAMAAQIDVTSLESWDAARAAAEQRFGDIDVLCNNAGIATPRVLLDELSPDLFARVMAINVTGVFNGVKTFASTMRGRRQGHIVNVSSVNGLIAHATFTAYSASKFAVTGMSDALRDELAPFGVGVSVLFPGLTRSRMSLSPTVGAGAEKGALPAAVLANMMEPIWLGRAVARAIETNAPYIISHPNHLATLQERFARVVAAFGEPAQPGYAGVVATTKQKP